LTSFGNEGGTGAKAQGEVHADTLQRRTIELCRAVASVVNRQIVRPLVLWNFGPDAPIPTWNFDIEEQEDLAARGAIDALLQRMGKLFTAAYVADRYDVPAVDGEPEILQPNPNADQVAAQIRDVSTFGEGLAALKAAAFGEAITMSPEMARDHAEFDKLMGDLKRKAKPAFKTRIVEVADAAGRGRR
jgi:phage gp29-like protein